MSNITTVKQRLIQIAGADNVTADCEMKNEVSFRAGGKADLLVIPRNEKELCEVLKVVADGNIDHFVMGNGSNILIRDGGYRGVIIKINSEAFSKFEILEAQSFEDDTKSGENTKYVRVGAGMLMSVLAKKLLANSIAGFEELSGIPGSIGGAVFMNAGAYGKEIKDILVCAKLISRDGSRMKELTGDELKLGYRDSILHKTGDIVTEAVLRLEAGDTDAIKAKMAEHMQKRNKKQPVNFPSAGSFFKRPAGYFAGKLVQDANLKGYTVGGAQVSELHSGFVINIGDATATDIIKVMEHCQKEVYDKFGVLLEPEVRILGED